MYTCHDKFPRNESNGEESHKINVSVTTAIIVRTKNRKQYYSYYTSMSCNT